MKQVNSFSFKITVPLIIISILFFLLTAFFSANVSQKNAVDVIFDKLTTAVYINLEYDELGLVNLKEITREVQPNPDCGTIALQAYGLNHIATCDDGQRQILIPTLGENQPLIYAGLKSISIWDSERRLIYEYPDLPPDLESLLRQNQRKILDVRLSNENPDFPNSYIYRVYPNRFIYSFINKDVIYGIPIFNDSKSEMIGSVIVIMNPELYSSRWVALRVFFVFILPLFLLVSFIGSFFIAQDVKGRLSNVQSITDQWATGNLTPRIQDSSSDEIGRLATDLNRMAKQLEESIDTKSVLIRLETRQKLARDLHDAAKQQLFAATMQLSAANSLIDSAPNNARKHLNSATDLTKQAQQELASVIDELRPIQLQETTFTSAVQDLITNFETRNNIPVQLNQLISQSISQGMEQSLFRLLQEALSNIAKHSQATHVEVNIYGKNDEIKLTITDNGIGFMTNQLTHGFGLKSMEQRVSSLNGTLKVNSQLNLGTTIVAWFKSAPI